MPLIDRDPGDEDDFEAACARMREYIERSIADALRSYRVGEDLIPMTTFRFMAPAPATHVVIEAWIPWALPVEHDSGDEDNRGAYAFGMLRLE